MIRITRIAADEKTDLLRVEGRLTHQTVPELQAAITNGNGGAELLRLDLGAVSFADRSGLDAIQTLLTRGAMLSACSGFLEAMLSGDQALPVAPADEGERRLVEELRRGDGAAYEQIVRGYGARMLSAARRLLGNEHDAEDAVQEAFAAAFKSIGQFNGSARLSTWLHRIVVNAALMKIRSRRRRAEESIDDLLPRFEEDGHFADRVNGWNAPAEEILAEREMRQRMRALVDRLPETYRTVLMLRDIEDLDTDEVAEMLGVTANAVKVRLHRARQALRMLVEKELMGS